MRSLSNETKTALSTPVREFKARVEVHRNSTLIGTYTQADAIQKAVIERIAEDGRFFGIGVCQKLKLTLVDKDRTFEIKKNDKLRISIGISSSSAVSETSAIAGKAIVGKAIVGTGEIQKVIDYIEFPSFYVEEVVYDDVSKQVSIEAYDVINKLKYYTVDDLGLTPPYSNKSFMLACAQKVGTVISMSDSYSTNYTKGGNFYGNENLRTAFDAAAESAGCVYYVNDNDIIKEEAKASKKKGKPFSAAAAAAGCSDCPDEEEREPLDPMFVDIQQHWNDKCEESGSAMRRLTIVTKNRQLLIMQRVKEHGGDAAVVYRAIDNAMKSDVLNGRKGSGWVANFDWMMKQDNFANVLEGVYNDENKKPQTSNAKSCNTDPSLDEAIKEAVEAKEETPEDKQRKLALSYIERVEREPNNGRLNGLLRMMQKNGTLEKLGIEWKPKAV